MAQSVAKPATLNGSLEASRKPNVNKLGGSMLKAYESLFPKRAGDVRYANLDGVEQSEHSSMTQTLDKT